MIGPVNYPSTWSIGSNIINQQKLSQIDIEIIVLTLYINICISYAHNFCCN